MPKEKQITLNFTEQEVGLLIRMISNENVELVQRVMDGQARIDTINKLSSAIKEETKDGNKKTNVGSN